MLKKIIALLFSVLLICGSLNLSVFASDCEHEDGMWGVQVDSTCTEPGSDYKVCLLCGYKDVTELAPTGHEYDGGSECTVCGALLGDINADNVISVLDFVKLKEFLLNEPKYAHIYDMDADKLLTASDIVIMKQILFAGF